MSTSNVEVNEVLQVARFLFDGVHFSFKTTGMTMKGIKNTGQLIYDIMNKEKLMGKSSMKNMLKISGGDLGYFEIPEQKIKLFEELAKKYGVLWVGLKDLNKNDGKAQFIFPNNARPRLEQIIKEMGCGEVISAEDYVKSKDRAVGDKESKSKSEKEVKRLKGASKDRLALNDGEGRGLPEKKSQFILNLKNIIKPQANKDDKEKLTKYLFDLKNYKEPVVIFGGKASDYIQITQESYQRNGVITSGFSLRAFTYDGKLKAQIDPSLANDKILKKLINTLEIQNPTVLKQSDLSKQDMMFLTRGDLSSEQQFAYIQFLQADQKMRRAGQPKEMRDSWLNTLFHTSKPETFRHMILEGKNPNADAIYHELRFENEKTKSYEKANSTLSSSQKSKQLPIKARLEKLDNIQKAELKRNSIQRNRRQRTNPPKKKR